jgi:hypothetical protein
MMRARLLSLAVLVGFLVGGAAFGQPIGSNTQPGSAAAPSRTVTAAGAVTITGTDYFVCINKTVGAATSVTLPAVAPGRTIIIKDCKGDASTNNITMTPASGTIDGAATIVIVSNFGAWRGIYNGVGWSSW